MKAIGCGAVLVALAYYAVILGVVLAICVTILKLSGVIS